MTFLSRLWMAAAASLDLGCDSDPLDTSWESVVISPPKGTLFSAFPALGPCWCENMGNYQEFFHGSWNPHSLVMWPLVSREFKGTMWQQALRQAVAALSKPDRLLVRVQGDPAWGL